MEWIGNLIFLFVGVLLTLFFAWCIKDSGDALEEAPGGTSSGEAGEEEPQASPAQEDLPPPEDPQTRIFRLAEDMRYSYERISHPRYLQQNAQFQDAVRELVESEFSTRDLLTYYGGDNSIMACMATEALAQRSSVSQAEILEDLMASINYPANYVRYFGLMTLHRKAEGPLLPTVLPRLNDDWEGSFLTGVLDEFIRRRVEAGEPLALGYGVGTLSKTTLESMRGVVSEQREEFRRPLLSEIQSLLERTVDEDLLGQCGKVLDATRDPGVPGPRIFHDAMSEAYTKIQESFRDETTRRSVLLIGEPGVGKSTLIAFLLEDLQRRGYTIFKADAVELLAGQKYIGELEQRIQDLVRELAGKKVLWVVERFHELGVAGLHNHSQTSILHMILPQIESGSIRLLGEVRPAGFEKVALSFPRLPGVMDVLRLEPLEDETTLALAGKWVAAYPERGNLRPRIPPARLTEAFELVGQYLTDRQAPGNLIEFLRVAIRRVLSERAKEAPPRETTWVELTVDDYIGAMAELTGLPRDVIDERKNFDLQALDEEFRRRVLGQPEAVEVLVDRVAMIKAGTTDPTRPLGVFLFAGPTGTGKTEIAKTFTRFLFGSEKRMIRLDMSEFQGPGSKVRLLGRPDVGRDHTALVNQIRQHPFSLILLDEFEKADPEVWDLFLQVFDDGRLTDSQGNTANFRNSIIILTSNIGASEAQSHRLGFKNVEHPYREDEFLKSIERTFRREFINRLDRVVIFRPLTRKIMREILKVELADVLKRRGLRNRPWVVEWDDSTLEFLLEKGFSPELGARPLRRAVEKYLLSPLSVSLVKGEMPRGDQFVLVSAREGKIRVDCIDPDAGPEPVPEVNVHGEALDTRRLVLSARGTAEELAYLSSEYELLSGVLELAAFVEKKEQALGTLSKPGFWNSPDRFETLSFVEYVDRVEAGLRSTGELINRLLSRSAGLADPRVSPAALRRIAQRIYLLETAYPEIVEGRPRDAFVRIDSGKSGTGTDASGAFARRMRDMYLRWGEARGMRTKVLSESTSKVDGRYRVLVAVEGFAAHTILSQEEGIHLFENGGGGGDDAAVANAIARVYVVPQPDEPPGFRNLTATEQAENALHERDALELPVIRRYQEKPSPLVRDKVHGWRTGRLDLVLGGNFDVLGG